MVPITTTCPVDEVEVEAPVLAAAASDPPLPPRRHPPPVPVPVTASPTVRLTEATVPEMVEVNDASARLVWAVLSEDSAEVTDASSESISVVEPPSASSLDRRACAAATLASAASTSALSAVVPTVARTCPAVTTWPACTSTPVTVPDTPKLRSAWVAGSSVPEVATVCLMVPVVTLTTSEEMTRPVAGDPPVNARASPVARPATQNDGAADQEELPLASSPVGCGRVTLEVELKLLGRR